MSERFRGEIHTSDTSREVEGFNFREFRIRTPEDEERNESLATVPQEPSSITDYVDASLVYDDYRDDPLMVGKVLGLNQNVTQGLPYTFLGEHHGNIFGTFFNSRGEKDLLLAETKLSKEYFLPDVDFQEILSLAYLLKGGQNFSHDELVASLQGLSFEGRRWKMKIQPGTFSESYYSNGIAQLSLNPQDYLSSDPESRRKLAELYKKYDKPKTVADALKKICGRVPNFNDGVYGNKIGVSTMLETSDGQFAFVDRDPKRVSVNPGINVPASGGVVWDEEVLRTHGIPGLAVDAMQREADEELGITFGDLALTSTRKHLLDTLGVRDGEYSLAFIGGIRELARGGSPEFMFYAQTRLSIEQLADRVHNLHTPDKLEAKTLLSLPADTTYSILQTDAPAFPVHPKAVLGISLVEAYRKANT